ncbi:type IV toxin-antitoxin system AbiEi family antitoxin domain-containing protein [Nocardioides sp.]|uniref:type IV toxin-antitoxin system AbiEi family antitoxin domain-containing protein n=1 Tax=Nocardioides sp. TaxID=35761 RepID=UPI00286BE4AC|nr:type IV toxin-antitoxin system AbiEi family antitoxin domain-containing protein [Nocardioides sp.]
MALQQGLVTRQQAAAAGLDGPRVDRLVNEGAWTAVRRGVYAETSVVAAAREAGWQARQLLADRAASLKMIRPHVMSHDSAALLLGLATLRPTNALTHVTRPGLVGSHVRHDVKHHLAPYDHSQVTMVDGRPLLDAARTAADVSREQPLAHGVVAFDSALRLGVTREALQAAVDPPMRCWPHVTRVRDALDLAALGADNPGESLARLLVSELGFGRPEVQFGLTDGLRTVWCDLRIGRHVFEFDGRVKYQRAEDGGVALASAEDVVWREKQRQDFVCGFKLGMSRIVWGDLWGDRRGQALSRMRREVLDTLARFGSSIDDLGPHRPRGPRPAQQPHRAA